MKGLIVAMRRIRTQNIVVIGEGKKGSIKARNGQCEMLSIPIMAVLMRQIIPEDNTRSTSNGRTSDAD